MFVFGFLGKTEKNLFLAFCTALGVNGAWGLTYGATATYDGATRYQLMDQVAGVNLGCYWYNDSTFLKAIDTLIAYGIDKFKVNAWPMNWESANDNSDPGAQNWAAYDAIFSGTQWNNVWKTIKHLNDKGITDGVNLAMMGPIAGWMASGNMMASGMEAEVAEYIAAAAKYGLSRRSPTVTFGHLTINNEPDITGHWEGATCGAAQSKVLTERVVDALNAMGLSNLEIVGPTTSTNNISYRDELRSSSKAMSKLKHFDSHHYGSSLGSNAYTEIKISLYPNMTYWVSEENIWCGGCDGGGRIPNTMSVGLDATGHVLSDLGNGVSGFYLWDGLDSYYDYAPVYTGFSGWGLMDYNTGTKQYTKRNYLLGCRSIICKFVLDGMRRINATAGYAFYDSATNRFSIVDRNTGGSYSLTGTLENLPTVSMLQFWYQDATHNVCRASDVSVANQQFTVTIPASSVWALHGAGTPTSLAPRSLRRPDRPDCLIRVVDIRGRILVAVNTDAFPAGVYAMYVGADHDRSQRFLHIASGNKQATFVNIP